MEKITQLKLFSTIDNFEDIRNMGYIIKSSSSSRGIYGSDYVIRLNKDILKHIDIEKLEDIIHASYHGYYGGHIKINILTNEIYIQYTSYND